MTVATAPAPSPTEVLARGLSERLDRPVRVTRLAAEPLDSFSTHPIERLTVSLDGGERLRVIFKRLRPKPGAEIAREPLLYERLLGEGRFGAPALYASLRDPVRDRHWLFLEDVGSFPLEWCSTGDWEAAFRWLAGVHAAFHGREEELRRLDCLPEQRVSFYRGLAEGARSSLATLGKRHALERFDALIDRALGSAVDALLQGPRTFVHGDMSCTNLMVEPGLRMRAIDWEWAAIGPAAWDLGKLLAGWGSERERFVQVYRREFHLCAGEPLDPGRLERQLRAAGVIKVLWYLRWWVARCEDPAFVDRLLDKLERSGG